MARKLDVAGEHGRHGIDPAANEAAMVAELAARGWTEHVEELVAPPGATGRTRRFRAMAFRPREPGDRGHGARAYRRAKGRTAEGALGQVLAAVLEREG